MPSCWTDVDCGNDGTLVVEDDHGRAYSVCPSCVHNHLGDDYTVAE